MSLYDTGIKMTSGFSIGAKKPADLKFLADTLDDRDAYVTNNLSYEGMLVFVNDTKKTYQFINNSWKEFGFNQEEFVKGIYDGLDSDSTSLALSARQGKVLNQKISTHDSNTVKHITSEERQTWNNKAETTLVTQTSNGLMSSTDKTKLDGIQKNANNYTHPDSHPASMIDEDSTHRFVSDTEKITWNNKAETTVVTISNNGLMSSADKIKLNGIENNANNYVHPSAHAATMITEDSSHRFVTDTEKSTWNAKASTSVVSQSTNGLMSSTDKKKLDGIAEGATNYTHPDSHPATIITQDSTHRFVTDAQINNWNSKPGTINIATPNNDGLMSAEDKTKLDNLTSIIETLQKDYNDMLAKLKTAVFYE